MTGNRGEKRSKLESYTKSKENGRGREGEIYEEGGEVGICRRPSLGMQFQRLAHEDWTRTPTSSKK